MVNCEKCGNPIVIGGWPFCPHEKVTHFGEDPLEPYVDWNLTDAPEGIEITTRAQRRKIMEENKFEYRPKAPRLGQTLYFDQKGR
jgi:hypothetical protein